MDQLTASSKSTATSGKLGGLVLSRYKCCTLGVLKECLLSRVTVSYKYTKQNPNGQSVPISNGNVLLMSNAVQHLLLTSSDKAGQADMVDWKELQRI